MPWTNQQGGDGGDRGPWGRTPQPSGGGGGSGGNRTPPDFEDMLRRAQDRVRRHLPGGVTGGSLLVLLLGIVVVWLLSGIYVVNGREQGVVLRFGQFVARTGPGINYHLPWPIESVEVKDVTSAHQLNIGYQEVAESDASHIEDVPEESLMLTGDENIVDVNFTVYWVINDAGEYVFDVEEQERTIKAVAESAMREVVGENEIGPILTQDRAPIENQVLDLMQSTLNSYRMGVTITQVKMQNVDTPIQVRDAYRDVQAARADQERRRNEAEAYANKIIPEARGQAAQIVQDALAYRQKVIAEASGEAKRFLSVYEEYKKAPEVTRKRMYLETLSHIYAQSNKIIVDENAAKNIIPYLPPQALGRGSQETVTVTPPQAGAAATAGPSP
jgi:membrane protease subunit HflK